MKYVLLTLCSTTVIFFFQISKADELGQQNRDEFTNQVLTIQDIYHKKLESDISKNDKCKVIYDQLHSNAQEMFVILGRIKIVSNIFKNKMKSYTGSNEIEPISKYIWPYIKVAPIGNNSRYELFLSMCIQSPDNTRQPGFISHVGIYMSTIESDNNQVLLVTEVDNRKIYVSWKKENGSWKLFSANPKLRDHSNLNYTEKKFVADIIANIHLVDSLNSECFKLENPILFKDDAKTIINYMLGRENDKLYHEGVKIMRTGIDKGVKQIIGDIETKANCGKTLSKVMGVMLTLRITKELLNSINNVIFI